MSALVACVTKQQVPRTGKNGGVLGVDPFTCNLPAYVTAQRPWSWEHSAAASGRQVDLVRLGIAHTLLYCLQYSRLLCQTGDKTNCSTPERGKQNALQAMTHHLTTEHFELYYFLLPHKWNLMLHNWVGIAIGQNNKSLTGSIVCSRNYPWRGEQHFLVLRVGGCLP